MTSSLAAGVPERTSHTVVQCSAPSSQPVSGMPPVATITASGFSRCTSSAVGGAVRGRSTPALPGGQRGGAAVVYGYQVAPPGRADRQQQLATQLAGRLEQHDLVAA